MRRDDAGGIYDSIAAKYGVLFDAGIDPKRIKAKRRLFCRDTLDIFAH